VNPERADTGKMSEIQKNCRNLTGFKTENPFPMPLWIGHHVNHIIRIALLFIIPFLSWIFKEDNGMAAGNREDGQ
jgi:hypothetical protein